MTDSTFVEITKMAKDLAFFAKDTFTEIAPEVWEMVYGRMLVEAKLDVGFAILIGIISVVCFVFSVIMEEGVLFVVGIILIVIALFFLYFGLIDIYALDYATLLRIIETVK